MNSKDSIVNGILKYSISTWANLIVGFASVVFTTRLLPPETYGLISLFYSFTSVLMYVLLLGMDGALVRFYNEPPLNNSISQLLYKNIVFAVMVCFGIGSFSTFVVGETLSNAIFGFYSRSLLGMCFLYTFCQMVLRFLNISFRMSFRVKQYTIQNIFVNCLSRVLVIAAAFFTQGFLYIVFVLSIGMFLVLTMYLWFQRREFIPLSTNKELNFRLDFSNYSDYFKFALFSAPTYVVTYLNAYLNNQIITSHLGSYSLGIFASTGMFSQILSALKGGFATYWSAYVYKNYKDEHEKIKKMHNYVLLAAIFLASGMCFFRDVIYLVIGEQFHESKQFFSLLLVSPLMFFLLETTDKGIALAKKNHITLLTHSIAVVVNVLFSVLFIRYYGLVGAAYANAFSGVVLYFLNTIWGQKYYKSVPNVYKSFAGLLLIMFILLLPTFMSNIFYLVGVILVVDFLAICLYRKEFFDAVVRVSLFFKRNKV